MGAIDRAEFEWKKKKKELQDDAANSLNKHTIHYDNYKKLKVQIEAAEKELKDQRLKEIEDEYARRSTPTGS